MVFLRVFLRSLPQTLKPATAARYFSVSIVNNSGKDEPSNQGDNLITTCHFILERKFTKKHEWVAIKGIYCDCIENQRKLSNIFWHKVILEQ